MELILALLIGIVCYGRWINERYQNVKAARYHSIRSLVEPSFEAEDDVRNLLSNNESRLRCFEIINADMEYIIGDDWRKLFENENSDFVFKYNLGKVFYSMRLSPIENVVYYLLLSYRGMAPDCFLFQKIAGFSGSESQEIIKRLCVVIERAMKIRHKDIERELDMFICRVGDRKQIAFRFKVDFLKLDNTIRLGA